MPVTPSDFFDIAFDYSKSCDEIQLRNSVSRAYYACYLHAINRVKAAGISLVTSPSGMHEKLIHTLNANGCGALCGGMTPPQQYELAGMLKLAKQLRTKSDYHLDETVTQDDKDAVLLTANEIIKRLP